MRPAHWLAGNKGGELPHALAFVDTETRERKVRPGLVSHHLNFGWASFERTRAAGDWTEPEWFRFTSPLDFWVWVESRIRSRTRLFLFAHNWAFDGPVLDVFRILPERGWHLTRAVIESPPVILCWRRDTITIEMLDTLNWWRMPLRKIGDSIGLPKLPMPGKSANTKSWDHYCRNDVQVIRLAVRRWMGFLETFDLGGFAPTLAAQALRAFRHRFMGTRILIDNDGQALTLARDSLHGGRTEAFRIGHIRSTVHCLDVNSMYPAVMETEQYPTRLLSVERRVDLDELLDWLDRYCLVARVSIETKRNRFAYVHEGKLVFPIGRMTVSLTTPDLKDVTENGELRAIHACAVYEKAAIFRDFVGQLYVERLKAKRAGNDVDVWLLKILMNSLYGKFAQRGERWDVIASAHDQMVKVWRELDVDTGRVYSYRQLGGVVQTKIREGESHDSHPAIASHVTAYARSRLWGLMQKARPGRVFYVDTDSLYVDSVGLRCLEGEIDVERLGALKHEGTYKGMTIRGAKDYEVPGHRVVKGVRASAVWNNDTTVTQEQWSTLLGLVAVESLSAPLVRTIQKRLRRIYDKGVVDSRGVVSPLTFNDWR